MNQNDELVRKIDKLQKALDGSMIEMRDLANQVKNAPSEYEKEELTKEMHELGNRIDKSVKIIENIRLFDAKDDRTEKDS